MLKNDFTYTNSENAKTTIFLNKITKIIWDHAGKRALVFLDGGWQSQVDGDKNMKALCLALGWSAE